jgi:thioredoxin reductase
MLKRQRIEMAASRDPENYDVAIVGGGPAGLNAAIILGRACRRVVLFDHGKPRNYAARAIHGFLGHNGISPNELRDRGRREAVSYGVKIHDCKVTSAKAITDVDLPFPQFEIVAETTTVRKRAVLLATGVADHLPEIPGIQELYGRSVHHCPYCDGWEHRQQHLVALADGASAAKLALSLKVWSPQVTACTNGHSLSAEDRRRLSANAVECREEAVTRLTERENTPIEMSFCTGPSLRCDALFFGGDQGQRSPLAKTLGCEIDEDDLIKTYDKQKTCVEGVFVAGDAAADVQFAIVAAAEGATAAIAINRMLQEQETG